MNGPLCAAMLRAGGVVLLALIQGLTEFLPVSSSGHLVVGSQILALAKPSLLLDVLLHVGTLLPVLWLYRVDIGQMLASIPRLLHPRRYWQEDAALRLAVCIVIGSVPTALIGFLFEEQFERLFSSTLAVGCTFLLTGAILLLTRWWRPQSRDDADGETPAAFHSLTVGRALAVGLAQGCAITPGISRSGTTIATGLFCGLERELCARFSFLLSIPAIVGATLLELHKAGQAAGQSTFVLLLGVGAAAVSGYLALRWVVHTVRRGELHWFTIYVWPLGLAVLAYSLWMR